MDKVFKALAHPARRGLLDALRARNGRSLGSLCRRLAMTRQAVTQHLARLEEAGLVTTARRGREKLHYLDPVPLHEIYQRWIAKYERLQPVAPGEPEREAEAGRRGRPRFPRVTSAAASPETARSAPVGPGDDRGIPAARR